MTIERDSVQFQILERLCRAPKAVRGTSGAMLERDYNAPWAVDELASAGLIRQRGWHDGPGAVWIPTDAGLALYAELAAAPPPAKPPAPRWIRKSEVTGSAG